MTAEVRTVRTAAEQAIVEHFARALPSLPGGARVRSVRERAFARFVKTGLPHRRIEEWKYTDLRALMRAALAPAERPDEGGARHEARQPLLRPDGSYPGAAGASPEPLPPASIRITRSPWSISPVSRNPSRS